MVDDRPLLHFGSGWKIGALHKSQYKTRVIGWPSDHEKSGNHQ